MVEKKRYGLPVAAILFAVSLMLTTIAYLVEGSEFGNYASLFYLFMQPASTTAILCVLLFFRKRDTMLLGALGALVLTKLGTLANAFWYINYYSSYSYSFERRWEIYDTCTLLSFVAYTALFLVALVLCEPSFIKKDLAKLRQVVSRLFFIPAVLLTIPLIIRWVDNAEYIAHDPVQLLWLAEEAVTMVAVLLLGKWLAYPKVTTVLVQPEMDMCKKELALLKKLLDMGTITQEEYDAKEQQLLDNARSKLAEEQVM